MTKDQKSQLRLRRNIHLKLQEMLSYQASNPVIKAKNAWLILSDQLLSILGSEVHRQWFRDVQPMLLKDGVLILRSATNFSASWINTHYQELADNLIKSQDKKYSCFFIAPTPKAKKLHF
jgi:hypothetical protein